MQAAPLKIAIIGLGYVGLPLAIEFSKKYRVIGFDINMERIIELREGKDHTLEIDPAELRRVQKDTSDVCGLEFTTDPQKLQECNIYIVTVPTPVDKNNTPDLRPLKSATETVGNVLSKEDIVIYESTVYPGCTEEACVPVLEQISGLQFNKDFYCGYSPERINPGDKTRTLTQIKKIVSGSTAAAAEEIEALYASIIPAGIFKASSIKVAEAAKVIENAQRDINIAFVNELAKIFNLLQIDTHEVLAAAGTKWNFLPFKPGLVGGHCIGVDPYYLAQKAISVGYYPEIILSGRRINDSIGIYIADTVIKLMLKKQITVWHASILVLGVTFKENCPDVRNTKVVDIVRELDSYKTDITLYDPWADEKLVLHEYELSSVRELPTAKKYDAIILAVAHQSFCDLDLRAMLNNNGVIYDAKGYLDPAIVDARL